MIGVKEVSENTRQHCVCRGSAYPIQICHTTVFTTFTLTTVYRKRPVNIYSLFHQCMEN